MRNSGFIGRQSYFKHLNDLWEKSGSHLACIYGRRRVGKTELVRTFAKNKAALLFEALESENTQAQVKHFLNQLAQQTGQNHFKDLAYKEWEPVFELLTKELHKNKKVLLLFDELAWMASSHGHLVSIIKYYWDTQWKQHPGLLFILCGSVASWMVKNVVKSKALYGRVSQNILLEPLMPSEVAEYIGDKRGQREVLTYLLCFGGIPKYLEEFNFNQSFSINVDKTCLVNSGFFVDEVDKIFYNQFKETGTYKSIVSHLLKSPMSLKDISKAVHLPSGGGLKNYLDNLIYANILEKIPEITDFKVGKNYRYYIHDDFLRFHAKFIAPHNDEIKKNKSDSKFNKFTKDKWYVFLGLAFEKFCLKYRYDIARCLDFSDSLIGCGPVASYHAPGYQYDLVFIRNDNVISLCEIKYSKEKLGAAVIKEFEQKIANTKLEKKYTLEKILICNDTPSDAVIESGYFHRILLADEIIKATAANC